MKFHKQFVFVVLAVACCVGCDTLQRVEWPDVVLPPTATTIPAPPTTTTRPDATKPAVAPDIPAGVTSCRNGGGGPWPHDVMRIPVQGVLRSARWQGDLIRLDYDSIKDWPRKDMGDARDRWQSWGGVAAYVVEGDALVGGWFDHLAREGQVVKDTKNWRNGYMRRPPRSGEKVYLCILATDGSRRSNLVNVE